MDFILSLGLDPTDWPTVRTGSGGLHHYLRKPAGVEIVGGLPDFPGIEFKTAGRQVVAAGSVHPETGRPYEWDELNDDPAAAPVATAALLEAIRRARTPSAVDAGGEHTPEEIGRMLDALDPEDFRDHGDWLEIMMACHSASAGEARAEFVDWSTRDPHYTDHAEEIGRRWDSLSASRNGEPTVTYKTLWRILRDRGAAEAIVRPDAAGDFDDDPGTCGPEEPTALPPEAAIVAEMNERFCAVLEGGKFVVFMEDTDEAMSPPRSVWTRLSREAFLNYFEDERLRIPDAEKERRPTKAEFWLRHPDRRKYPGIVMDPSGASKGSGKLNLWRGWSVEPKPGDWSLMRGLIEEVLCSGSQDSADYVLRWMAFMLQRPWESPEAAIAFRGAEGTGKGTLGRALMSVAGPHGLTVSSPAQFAGRFNAHLRDCVFLFADEAFWPGDKGAEGVLKQLVTEPVIAYEAKGKDIVPGRNMVHMMLASNEQWIVPAGLEARRFFVQDVSDARRNDREFFGRLRRQLDDGGLAGMAHELMSLDLDGWHPSRDIPQTEALADQKLRSLDPILKFWNEFLDRGELPLLTGAPTDLDWREGPVSLDDQGRNALVGELDSFLKRNRILHVKATHRALLQHKDRLGLAQTRPGGQRREWVLPPLDEMRSRFEAMVGIKVFD